MSDRRAPIESLGLNGKSHGPNESHVNIALPYVADFQLAQACLDGDEMAVRTLINEYRGVILGVLVKRGAPIAEAEETVGLLWSECISRSEGRPGRLEGYNGECKLATYLNTVAFNMWLTERRKRRRQQEILEGPDAPGPASGAAGTSSGDGDSGDIDAPLIELLRAAIEAGAQRCSAEHFVVLQLTHADELLGRELARIFGCGEPWISRMVKRAEAEWRQGILDYVKERDPMLVVQWEDFVELCSASAPACFGLD